MFKNIFKTKVKEDYFSKGWSNDNNGYEIEGSDVERLISVRPTELQAGFADNEYYSFIHYGMNTFTGVEWGSGKESPEQFNPDVVDTDQWAKVIKSTGSSGIIFTAKHHDGFCLFQTEYTEHSIKNSPYKNGKGDIVKELSESCKKYGLKFGIYLSPWDRHEKTYGQKAYDDYFVNQLTELCTNYGDIFVFWFDGAKGKEAPDFDYDFERYYEVIRKLQPGCIIANCGPDVRWIGNEAGRVRESEWCVISSGSASVEETMKKSQQTSSDSAKLQEVRFDADDQGSRNLVLKYRDLIWKQPEADVSIHYDWFYNKKSKVRSAKLLSEIYFKTVGGNALLLMNVPPSKNGVIEDEDVRLLKKFKSLVDGAFTDKLDFCVSTINKKGTEELCRIKTSDGSYPMKNNENYISLSLNNKHAIKTIILREDIRKSQRVEKFEVFIKYKSNNYLKVYDGTVIGSKKIIRLNPKNLPETDEIIVLFKQSRSNPVIREISVFA